MFSRLLWEIGHDKMSFRVFKKGEYPKKKKLFYKENFETRKKALNFCRNRKHESGLTLVHPDGKEEKYEK